jgi:fatty-acyl-CoA synthase
LEETMLKGLMMERPLLISDIITYAAEIYPMVEVISESLENGRHRTTYGEAARRIAMLAHALNKAGVRPGDRVATLAWNGYRHLELYYAVAGIGAVCHTINPRLIAEQISFIIGQAQDRLLFADLTFLPLMENLRDKLPRDLRIVLMTDQAHMPASTVLIDLGCYEEMIAGAPTTYTWPALDERTASGLCYTSGTTGNPKGALYSHRSTVLHALSCILGARESLQRGNRILPVVPLFHANAWGLPYSAPLAGAALVLPGAKLDGASLFDLMDQEQVNVSWGVPAAWHGLIAEMTKRARKPAALREVLIGGAAAPVAMIDTFERDFGVNVVHGWGMTEIGPVGTLTQFSVEHDKTGEQTRRAIKRKQGRRNFGVELKIVDNSGTRLPHDGKSVGHLYVRGNTVVSGYYRNEAAGREAIDAEDWFCTGDIASIDAEGFMAIADRSKDLIKSGGEWISSIDLENVVSACPGIATCAVIGVPHPKWDERPLVVAVRTPGMEPTREDVLAFVSAKVARWQIPDDVVFVAGLPLTATGKISKRHLREQFQSYRLPTVA